MNKLKKSLLLSFTSKYSQLAITFFSSLVIARLLSPEEIGIYSVVAGIVVVAHMLRDFGVSSYIVKEDNLTDQKSCAAFLVTAALSWLAASLLFFSAHWLADFFKRQEVVEIVQVISINFIIIPFGSVSLSLLRKSMNFKALLVVNVGAALVNAVTTIVLAYLGFSYMSLVWSSVAGAAFTVASASYFRQKVQWIIPTKADIKAVFGFGSNVSLTNIMNALTTALPEMLIGRYIGMHTVGLVSRAKGLTQLFHLGVTQAILPVLLPDLVNKKKLGGTNAEQRYVDAVFFLCCVGWPFFSLLAVIGTKLIYLLYGQNWIDAGRFIPWFALTVSIRLITILSGEMFVAMDKAVILMKSRLIVNVFIFIVMTVSIQYGIKAFLIGLVINEIFIFSVIQYYLAVSCKVRFKMILSSIMFPFLLSMLIILTLYFVSYIFNGWMLKDVFYVIFNSIVALFVWVLVVFIVNSKMKSELLKLINGLSKSQ